MSDTGNIKEQVEAMIGQMEELIEQMRPMAPGPQRMSLLAKVAQRRDKIEDLLGKLPPPERRPLEERANKIVKIERPSKK